MQEASGPDSPEARRRVLAALLLDHARWSQDGWFVLLKRFRKEHLDDVPTIEALIRDNVLRDWFGRVAWSRRALRLLRSDRVAREQLRLAGLMIPILKHHYDTQYDAELDLAVILRALQEVEPIAEMVDVQRTIVMLQAQLGGLTITNPLSVQDPSGTQRPLTIRLPEPVMLLTPAQFTSDDDLPDDLPREPAETRASGQNEHPNAVARRVLRRLYEFYLERGNLNLDFACA